MNARGASAGTPIAAASPAASWQRVWSGLGANAFGQAVTIGTQLASLPLFLHVWTLQQYGVWLLLSAAPAYFSLADLGVGTVAMNRMTMLAAQGRMEEAGRAFQTALALTAFSTLALLAPAMLVIWSFDIGVVDNEAARTTLSLLVATALLGTCTTPFDGLFRASGKFTQGTFAIHGARLAEWLGGIAGLALAGSMMAVALGCLVVRATTLLAMVAWSARSCPQFRWGFAGARRHELAVLLPPAFGFLALPAGNALLLQGMSIVVGSTFGPAALALFSTYRTLSRVPVQLLTMFTRSLWPEMSRCYGSRDFPALQRMYRTSTRYALAVCAVVCLALLVAGPFILRIWSHGKIGIDWMLLLLFLAAALAGCAWQVAQVLLSATNTHARMALWYVGTALLVVLVAAALPAAAGPAAVAATLVLFDLIMIIVSRRLVSIPLQGAR